MFTTVVYVFTDLTFISIFEKIKAIKQYERGIAEKFKTDPTFF